MHRQTLIERAEKLELAVEGLHQVAGRFTGVETQLEGVENRLGAVEARLGGVETRVGTVEEQIVQLRTDMNAGFADVRLEMRALNQEVLAQSRLLYEDLRDRLKLLAGSRKGRKREYGAACGIRFSERMVPAA